MNCTACTLPIESERLEILPTTRVCSSCAHNMKQVRPKGIIVFDHKTGGSIQVVSEESFKDFRKYAPYGKNTGRGSGVHRMMRTQLS